MRKLTSIAGHRSMAEQAYAAIKRDIVLGKLEAGSKLRLEALSQRYGVGMAPLREALTQLVGEMIIRSESQRGFWVAPLSRADFDDLTRVRTLIECEALSLSIQRADQAWRERVRAAFEVLGRFEERAARAAGRLSGEDSEQWEELNQAFHEALISNCGSPLLLRLQNLCYQQATRYRHASRRASAKRRSVHDEHAAIFEAAIAGNVLRACRALEHHLSITTGEIGTVIEQASPPAEVPSKRRAKR